MSTRSLRSAGYSAAAAVLAVALFAIFALLFSRLALASPAALAATSSIKLTFTSGSLALVEQAAGANGSVSLELRRNGTYLFLVVTLPAGNYFAATSTPSGANLTYSSASGPSSSNVATMTVTTLNVNQLTIDMGSGSASQINLGALNASGKFGTVNLTSAGALTLTEVVATAAVSASVGSIASGSALTNNVTAPRVQLSGTLGVGAVGNPLRTATPMMEMNTISGSIVVSNTGDLTLGITTTNKFKGVQVGATSGDFIVDLRTSGTLSITNKTETVLAPGNVTVTAGTGMVVACMTHYADPKSMQSTGGTVVATSLAGDIKFGRFINPWKWFGDMSGAKGFTLLAPNGTILVDTATYLESLGGPVVMKGGTAVRFVTIVGSGSSLVTSGITPVTIDAPLFEASSSNLIASSSAPMTITADLVVISNTVSASGSTLWIRPRTPGRAIEIGVKRSADALGISTLAMSNLDASDGTIHIGGPDAGPIRILAATTRSGTSSVWLDTTTTITQAAGAYFSNPNLRVSTADATFNQNNVATLPVLLDGLLKLAPTGTTRYPMNSPAFTVGDGTGAPASARFQWQGNNLMAPNTKLTIYGDGLFNLDGFQQTLTSFEAGGALSSTAGVNLGSGGVLTVTPATGLLYTGLISGTGTLIVSGTGTLTLTNNNTFSALDVRRGKVLVNGTTPSAVTLNGGTLGGYGAVGAINALSGTVAPGASTAIFTAGSVTLGASSVLSMEINGLDAGSGYDQLRVTGGITLANATLAIIAGPSTTIGDSQVFTLIDNRGTQPVSGTFGGLPEGSFLTLWGKSLRLSYAGGDGNDVTLSAAAPPVTGINGVVSDAGSGLPLVGAQVVMTDSASHIYAVTTGAGGWYTVTSNDGPLAAGTIALAGSYPGYAATVTQATIAANALVTTNLPLRTVNWIVSKDDGLATVNPGQQFIYTIRITNTGSLTSGNLIITDVLPANLTYVSSTGSGYTFVPPSTHVWSYDSMMAPNFSASLNVTVRVPISLPYGTTILENRAQVGTSSPERDVTNNSATDLTSLTAYPDLSLTKSGVGATSPVSQSSIITYVLRGSNGGYAIAPGVVITDALNTAMVTYNEGSAVLAVNGSTRNVSVGYPGPLRFYLPDLLPQDSYVLTFTGRITNNIPIGTQAITNSATIGSGGIDGNPSDNTGSVLLPVESGAVVYLNKAAYPTAIPARPGSRILYELKFGNAGNSTATAVVITDTLPANTTFVSGSGGYIIDASGNITWEIGGLPTDYAGQINFTVQISDPVTAGTAQITNTGYITSPEDAYIGDNASTAVVGILTAPNLAVTKSNGQAMLDAGALTTYTLILSNTGNIGLTGVVVTDSLISNLAMVSSTPAAGANPLPGIYTWNVGSLAGKSAQTITVVARVNSAAGVGALAANRVTIGDDGTNGTEANRADNISTDGDIIAAPYVILGKNATGDVYAGSTVTYTIAYRNAGSATAGSVVVSDVLPVSTSLRSGSVTPAAETGSDGTLTWTVGSVAAGAGGVLTFAVNITGTAGVTTTAQSLAIASVGDSYAVTSSVAPAVIPNCQFGAACTGLTALAQGADPLGPQDWNSNPRVFDFNSAGWVAPAAAITESTWALPQGVGADWVAAATAVTTDTSYSFYRQLFCAPVNARTLGARLTLANADVGTVYLNGVALGQKSGAGTAAQLNGDGAVQNGINLLAVRVANNAGNRNGLIYNLGLTYDELQPFVAAPAMVQVNQPVPFTLNTQALGGRAPYSYTINYGDGTSALYQPELSFTHVYTTAGAFVAHVTVRDQSGCTGTNSLTVTVPAADRLLLANRATLGYASTSGTLYSGEAGTGLVILPDLALAKVAWPNPVGAASILHYTVTVTNTAAAAHNVVVQDQLPDQVSLAAAEVTGTAGGSCGANGSTVTCALGDLGQNDTRTIAMTVNVASGFAGVITNTAIVASDDPDPVPADNSASVPTIVENNADIGILKTSEPALHTSGANITYTLVVTNSGPVPLSAITLTDQLPAALSRVNYLPGSGSYEPHNGSWYDIDLAAGGRITLTITALVALTQTGDLTNTATITTWQANDPNPANNSAVDVNQRLVLELAKTGVLDPDVVAPAGRADVGDRIIYTLTASNTLPITLTNVAISDPLLGALACTQPFTLTSGASSTCTGVYTLTQNDINAGQVQNTATGTSDQTPPQPAAATVLVPQTPGLALAKTGTAGPVTIGDRIYYTLAVTNTGNLPLSNVRLTDPKLAFTRTITALGVGQAQVYAASYGPVTESDALPITNTAEVTGLTPAGLTVGPVTGSYTVTVIPRADLSVAKWSRPNPVGNGAQLTYTIVVTNAGPATARFVTVTEGLPTGLTYVAHTATAGFFDDAAGRWTMNTLAPSGVATLTLVTRVATDTAAITNVAAVTSAVADPLADNNAYTDTTVIVATGIDGRVYDDGSKLPIVGARVAVADSDGHIYTVTTGSGGWYTVTYRAAAPLTAGAITVTGSYTGYAAAAVPGALVYGEYDRADIPLGTANLRVTKDDGVTAVVPGQRVTYTIGINNLGTLTATNVVITDVLPAYMEYKTDTAELPVTIAPPYTYTWALDAGIAPGSGFTFTLVAQVAANVPAGRTNLVNRVRVSTGSPERDVTDNENTDTNTMTAWPDLSLAKDVIATTPVSVTQPITYVLRGANAGTALAAGVQITDLLNTTLITYTTGSAELTVDDVAAALVVTDAGTLGFGLPDLAPGASYVLTFTVRVTDNIPAGVYVITNTAIIGGSDIDTNLDDNADTAIAATQPGVALYVRSTPRVLAAPARPGEPILYTLAYGNMGNTLAPDTVLSSTLPAETSFVTGSPGVQYDSLTHSVTWPARSVAAAATGSVTFTMQITPVVPAGTEQLVATAGITTPAGVLTEEYLASIASVPLSAAPDLGIVKQSTASPLNAGDTVTYTLIYSNSGNMAAAGVVITDTPLVNLNVVTTTPPYVQAGTVYTWDIGSLGVDGSHTITVVATVAATAPARALVANRAEIGTAFANDANPLNDVSTRIDVAARPQVVLAKRAAGYPVVGGVVTYTIAYENVGNGAASSAVITDAIPLNTTLVDGSISSGGVTENGVITWTFPIPAGANGEITFAVDVLPGAGHAAAIAPSQSIVALAGSVVVTSSVSSVTQAYCSDGADCSSLLGIWQGPDGVGPDGWNGNPRVGEFAAVGWQTPIPAVTLPGWLPSENLDAEWVANTDTAQSAANYSFYRQSFCVPLNGAGLSAGVQVANADSGDIYLNGVYLGQKTGAGAAGAFSGASAIQNGLNVLAVRVLNNNLLLPDNRDGLLFKLEAPYSALNPFVAAAPMALVDQVVTFTVDPLALNGQAPYSYQIDFGDGNSLPWQPGLSFAHAYTTAGVYTATITGRDQSGCTGVNPIVVTVQPLDGNLLDNRAGIRYANAYGVSAVGEAGGGSLLQPALSVSKSAFPDPVVAGQVVTYTLWVTDTGAVAHAAVVTDVLPSEVTFGGATPGCTYAAGAVRCPAGDMHDGDTATFTVTGSVAASAGAVITNSASAGSQEPDLAPANSHTTLATGVGRVADLGIAKTSESNLYIAGLPVTYTIVVTNGGPSALTAITVTDNLPDGFDATSYVPSEGAYSSATQAWTGIDLAVGHEITLTVGGTVLISKSGNLTNTAVVTPAQGIDPYPENNTAQDVSLQVALTLTKTGALVMDIVAPDDMANAGDIISYTLTATNTGAVPLTYVQILDPALADLVCPEPATLNPGEDYRCQGAYLLTQHDIYSLQVNNLAYATADQSPPVYASVAVPIPPRPQMTVVKTSLPLTATMGDSIVYSLTVQNTGNLVLTDTLVTDPWLGFTRNLGMLDVDASQTVTATYGPLTELDLPGPLVNTAGATATILSVLGGTIDPPVTAAHTVTVTIYPGLAITKTSGITTATIGDRVPYTFTIANTGNVTLTDVTLVDGMLNMNHSLGKLVVGQTQVVTAIYGPITEADLPGPIANTASITGLTPLATEVGPVTATNTVTLTIYPGLAVTKTGTGGPVGLGTMVDYTITVQNTGNVTLTDVTVNDARIGLSRPIGKLASGEIATVTTSYGPLTEVDLPSPIVNTATVTGVTPLATEVGPVTSTYAVSLTINPNLAITKTSSVTTAKIGELVGYTITIQNTGDVTLTNVTVRDPWLGLAQDMGKLVVGQVATVTASYGPVSELDLPGPIVNSASVTGTTPGLVEFGPVTGTQVVAVAIAPGLALTKTGDLTAAVGSMAQYTITVQNTGDVTLKDVTVRDPKTGLNQNIGKLLVGQIATVTTSYGPVTETDLPGPIANTASVTATTPITTEVGPVTSSHAVAVAILPGLAITKTSNFTTATMGDLLIYTITVQNTGNVTLTNVVLTDDWLAVNRVAAKLVVGQAASITATYGPLTELDLPGPLTNVAAVTGITPRSETYGPVTTTQVVALTILPNLAVTKTGTAGPVDIGGMVDYTITVQNTGNVTLTNVTVDDPKIGLNRSAGTLVVGQMQTVTGSYGPVTELDLPGPIANTAGVTATTPITTEFGPVTSTYAVVAAIHPNLAITKTGSAGPLTMGDTAQYTITVHNTGDVTLDNVTVSDQKTGLAQNVGKLSTGELVTVTATYGPIGEQDLPGPITNTAGVTATTPITTEFGPVTSTYAVPLTIFPGLAITKTGSPGPLTISDSVLYTITVENTGNVTLTAVTVADPLLWPTPPVGTLYAGQSAVLTGTYGPIGENDLPGPISNTVSVSGTTPLLTIVGPLTSTYAVSLTTYPGVTMQKIATPTSYLAAGTVISYTYIVTNSGNIKLGGPVTVVDDKVPDVACPAITVESPLANLYPQDSVTCTGFYTTTEADVNAGSVTNVATATLGAISSPAVAATVYVGQSDLAVAKSGDPAVVTAGNVLTYTIVVTNAGPSPSLSGLVTDSLPAGLEVLAVTPGCAGDGLTILCPLAQLAPSAVQTFEIAARVDVSVTGIITNEVDVSGSNGDPNPANNHASAVVEVNPYPIYDLALGLAAAICVSADNTAAYTVTLVNQGTLPSGAYSVTLTVPPGMLVDAVSDYGVVSGEALLWSIDAAHELAPGQARLFTARLRSTDPLRAPYASQASVYGDSGSDVDSVPALESGAPAAEPVEDDEAAATVHTCGLAIEKVVNAPWVVAGKDISFTLRLTNTGTLPLSGIVLVDQMPPGMSLSPTDANGWQVRDGVNAVAQTYTATLGGSEIARLSIVVQITGTYGSMVNTAVIEKVEGAGGVEIPPIPIERREATAPIVVSPPTELPPGEEPQYTEWLYLPAVVR